MSKLSILEEVIFNILEQHRGKNNPITAQELQRKTLASSRRIRKTIANMVVKHRIPIASSVIYPYGFYLITDQDEARKCLEQYWSRVREVSKRAKILSQAVKAKFDSDKQRKFDFK
jgi:hypothetical protein